MTAGCCESWEAEVLDLAEGMLPASREEAVRGHLEGCSRCARIFRSARALSSLSSTLPRAKAPPGLWERVSGALPLEDAARRGRVVRLVRLAEGLAAALLIGGTVWLVTADRGRGPAHPFVVLHAPRAGSAEEILHRFYRAKEVVPGLPLERLAEQDRG